jgi:iron complex transport system ATP-binding protein
MVLEMVRARKKDRVGVLVVLHDLALAADIADDVVLLARGKIARRGSPKDVLVPNALEPVFGVKASVDWKGDRAAVRFG